MNFNHTQYCSQPAACPAKKLLTVFLLAAAIAVSSCGGGSVSTASTSNELPSPVAKEINGETLTPASKGQDPAAPSELELLPVISVNQRQFADPNVLLNLHGAAVAAADATIAKTLWTQVTGPQVRIPSPLSLDNEILIPDVSITTQLEFRLTAQDSKGRINSATLVILVKPVPTFVKVIGGVFNETDTEAVFSVQLNAPSNQPITISYSTQNGTANNGTDYLFTSGAVTLAAGELSKKIPVALINDTLAEKDENFSLQVTAIDGTSTYANRGVAIIHNGSEPQLQQTIQFSYLGSARVYVDQQYSNPLDPAVVAPGTGEVIYSSSNTAVARVNAQGMIIPLAIGITEITATKLPDNNYLPASTSFVLQVVSRGAAPQVQIQQSDGYSVEVGGTLSLSGNATDPEDGPLPTQQQIADNAATGLPIDSLRWESNIQGLLGFGSTLNIQNLMLGTHTVTYRVTDSDGNTSAASIRALIGNLAPLATINASSTYCIDDCYSPNKINDSILSTLLGPLYSWVNDDSDIARWISLTWQSPVTINAIALYTTEDQIIQDYDIEYADSANSWARLASVTGNTDVYRSHTVAPVTTTQLMITVRKGSIAQPVYGRINEVAVFGTVTPQDSPDIGFSSASSSTASSARISSSSTASSSVMSSSTSSSLSVASSSRISSSSMESSSVVSSSTSSSLSVASSSRISSSSMASSSVRNSSTSSSLSIASSSPISSSSTASSSVISSSTSSALSVASSSRISSSSIASVSVVRSSTSNSSLGSSIYHIRGTFNAWAQGTLMGHNSTTGLYESCINFANAAGGPRFKIDPNGGWIDSIPAADFIVSQGWVKVFFNSATRSITVQQNLAANCVRSSIPHSSSASASSTASRTEYHLRGTFNAWAEGTLMVPSGTTNNYVACINFVGGDAAGGPRFKIDPNGGWGDAIPAADFPVSQGWALIFFNRTTQLITVEQGRSSICAS